ncbi:MAG: SMC-Scp complex subunit ScpB [Hyphomicrobiales bacterium]|nr:SMC-Scp complex subunit ScpB [Hyphomicrobiales bacterium]MDE2114282.1 SMC-Scp complex subunit ScpB [Hyphomicrobiales bacterium]
MARPKSSPDFDRDLSDLPEDRRWRIFMGRIEAVIFASPEPVPREILAKVVSQDCNLNALLADIAQELQTRPYELVAVAGGWQLRTRKTFADAILAVNAAPQGHLNLSAQSATLLMAIACFQPITRGDLGKIFGKEISRDQIATLKAAQFIASGPRSPSIGAPTTLVTTPAFLTHFGFNTLRDLPDYEALEDAGLLERHKWLADEVLDELVVGQGEEENDEAEGDAALP